MPRWLLFGGLFVQPTDTLIALPVKRVMLKEPLLDILLQMDFLDLETGPWVAGGAALALARGKRDISQVTADIDIFTRTLDEARAVEDQLLKALPDWKVTRIKDSNGAMNWSVTRGDVMFRIQSIVFNFQPTLPDLLRQFDFSVAMFATDGVSVVGPPIAWKHLGEKVLHRNGPYRKTMWRLSKYCEMGFVPSIELVRDIVSEQVKEELFVNSRFRMRAIDDY